mmetsp:Transcript_32108/g.75822  ORF Transcript_32108/g.75822 Transcript_32108/m.75822 type:complete len:317 (-) Transcript_32108:11-961(-)
MNLLCLVLCACGLARIAALQATTVPERKALLSLVQQVASPTALFQTSKADCRRVSEVCEALERAAALDRPGFPRDLMLVDGLWRCIFTSAGVSVVPTPVLRLVGATPLGGVAPTRVEQRIDVMGRRVVNCVDLTPWPSGPLGNVLARAPGPLGSTLSALRDATISLELDHAFTVAGDGSDGGRKQAAASATIEIRLEEVRRSLTAMEDGLASLIPRESSYTIPGFIPSEGNFETTFVDQTLRISRGGWPGNELRVFERVIDPTQPTAAATAQAVPQPGGEPEPCVVMEEGELNFKEEMWCEDDNDYEDAVSTGAPD